MRGLGSSARRAFGPDAPDSAQGPISQSRSYDTSSEPLNARQAHPHQTRRAYPRSLLNRTIAGRRLAVTCIHNQHIMWYEVPVKMAWAPYILCFLGLTFRQAAG